MGLHIYLKKGDSLDKRKVFNPENSKSCAWSLNGKTILYIESTPLIEVDSPLSVMNQFGLTEDLFLKATLRTKISVMKTPREFGVYVFGKAKATLTSTGNHYEFLLEVETSHFDGFNDMETIQELILSGSIAPVLSYSAPQKEQSLPEVMKYILSKQKLSIFQRFMFCWKMVRS